MLSFYLSALESAADKEDFRALYRRYHGVMERTGHSAKPARCGGGRAGGFYPGD